METTNSEKKRKKEYKEEISKVIRNIFLTDERDNLIKENENLKNVIKSQDEKIYKLKDKVGKLRNNTYIKLIHNKNRYTDQILNIHKEDLLSIEKYIINQNNNIHIINFTDNLLNVFYTYITEFNTLLNTWTNEEKMFEDEVFEIGEKIFEDENEKINSIKLYNKYILDINEEKEEEANVFTEMIGNIKKTCNKYKNCNKTITCILTNQNEIDVNIIKNFKNMHLNDDITLPFFIPDIEIKENTDIDEENSDEYTQNTSFFSFNDVILIFGLDTNFGVNTDEKYIIQGAMFNKICMFPCILKCVGYNFMYLNKNLRKGILQNVHEKYNKMKEEETYDRMDEEYTDTDYGYGYTVPVSLF